MPRIVFIQPNGESRVIDADTGHTVMNAAVNHSVPGIDADCGGACACATCHVYVDPDWFSRLPPAEAMESDMLECAHEPNARSRLSCQLRVTQAVDGLVVHLPTRQA